MTTGVLRTASVILVRTVAVLVIAVLVALSLVLTSNRGARWAVDVLCERVPGLSVGQVEGSLLRGLVLGALSYARGDVDVELRKVVLEPDLAPVLKGRLVLERLEIRGGSVNVPPANGPPPLPGIPEYLAVRSLRISHH